MRLHAHFSVIAIGFALAMTACMVAPDKPKVDNPPAQPDTTNLPDGSRLGEKVEVDGAVIYAVLNDKAPLETEYLTLHEAMEAKQASVRERSEGGTVNTLLVCNNAKKPLFLMAGDLLLGGKQDRIVAESAVLDAGAQDAEIQVFCVEHGRWSLQAKDTEKCRDGAFYTDKSMPQCDLAVKKAAIETKQQGRVWSEVASNNMALNVARKTSSGTFRATFDDPETREKIEKNVAAARKLAEFQVVGFAVYVEGEMVAMDVFESCGLAQKLADKLLRSYVITGLSGGYKDEVTVANDASNAEAEDVATAGEIDQVESQADRSCCLSPRERFAQQHATNNVGRAAAPRTGNEELAVNDRTANTRSYKENALDYACNDKKSGRAVQQSFMRR